MGLLGWKGFYVKHPARCYMMTSEEIPGNLLYYKNPTQSCKTKDQDKELNLDTPLKRHSIHKAPNISKCYVFNVDHHD